ncbi:ATP12 family protein [Phenylobacterium sp.]|uniref:ATP12 family chaperone protein n=1 Tax=Phenylobacterium sp. TaxID=1871053 RepID=UPI00286AB0A2|nr:ATP12 family protein [Phenylobacterium sp.]
MARGYREPGEKPRRFYKAVEVVATDAGFAVRLDGRGLRTPRAGDVVLPTRALADQVAEEWAGQGETLALAAMHATRLANTAIDAIPQAREATAQVIADYAASDLVCYFATEPAGLVARQQAYWGPLLGRLETEAGLRFVRGAGIVHQPQPDETLDQVKALALALDDFGLAGLAFGAALFGSAVLVIALQRGWLAGEDAFALSRVDEVWQEDQWGVDAEAAERTERLRGEAAMLARWFRGLAR